MRLPQHSSFGDDSWYIWAFTHNSNNGGKLKEINYNYYKAFLVNTFEIEKVQKCKSSPNLEYTYKIEVSTTMYDFIHSSTRIANKHENYDEW